MRILAFDTSGNACSTALWCDGAVVAHRRVAMERGHAEALMPMVVETLAVADCGFDDLDWLAVTVGPGSFTGIRAGLAAARGIALARAIPALGVDVFATVLHRAEHAAPPGADLRLRAIALDSRRRELYLRIFSPAGEPLSDPEVIAPEEVSRRVANRPVMLAGSAAAGLEAVLRRDGVDVLVAPDCAEPDAADLAAVAADRIAARGPGDALPPPPAPLYLHPPYAVLPAAGGRLRP